MAIQNRMGPGQHQLTRLCMHLPPLMHHGRGVFPEYSPFQLAIQPCSKYLWTKSAMLNLYRRLYILSPSGLLSHCCPVIQR